MADVTLPDGRRGQLILVAGLTIAVILVALVLLLNTVIYTENVATRGLDGGGDDAIEYQNTVIESVDGIVTAENEVLHADETELENDVANSISHLQTALYDSHIRTGTYAEFDFDPRYGIHVWQEEEEISGENVITEAEEIRRFELEIDAITFTDPENESFDITIGGASYEINESGANYDLINDAGTECNFEDSIDFVGQTVDASENECPDGFWTDITGESSIAFTMDSEVDATGSFSITARSAEAGAGATNEAHIVYDATVDIRYENSDVRYGTTVDIEGAEPR